jgi:hypothetical protein
MCHPIIGALLQAGTSLHRIFQIIILTEAGTQPFLITQLLLIIIVVTGVM